MAKFRMLEPGDPAPWFRQECTSNPQYNFDTVGGRYIVLCFHGSAADETGRAMLALIDEERALFDDANIAIFGVSFDPQDRERLVQSLPGVRHFWDFDGRIGKLYGAVEAESDRPTRFRRFWAVLDPALRVMKLFASLPDGSERHEVAAFLKSLPSVDERLGFAVQAPVIVLPEVFEPELCRHLIGLYEEHGGTESGFMREVDGRTLRMSDERHKRRADYVISDGTLIEDLRGRFTRRVVPEIRKVHQFEATRMERYIVACYDSRNGGHFAAHRDNTTRGTAHRRFAVSVNLNDDFEGGEVCFPEYGRRSFKPPPGGAVVFSCSLLHAVSPVTRGRRYAFLPFLYDEAAAAIRQANAKFIGEAQHASTQ